VFDLGCGNGSIDQALAEQGFRVVGVDPSEQGISVARKHFPHLRLALGSAYDDLAAAYGTFPAVISLEVVEHIYSPRDYARTVYSLLQPGGTAIISTPYHGYLKNLLLALTNQWDHHINPLWDNGHIKMWSRRTLGALLREVGFARVRFARVGRVPALAKSMIAIAEKPAP
jgi:2-polyprenyl-3-methyl-5-hydroxy-6-metoxy-1,4-benzoquinol methylase